MKKKRKVKSSARTPRSEPIPAAYIHFNLKFDPFTTLSLNPQNLDWFVGRVGLMDRLCSTLFSLAHVGLAGEPGVGKSSLMRMIQSRAPRHFHTVRIGVPIDNAEYFLKELLREMLIGISGIPGMNFKSISRRLEKEGMSKNEVFLIVRQMALKLKKPLLVFVDGLEKIKSDRIHHLTRSERTQQVLEEIKPLLELPNLGFAISLQEEFYAKIRSVVQENGDPTVLGFFKNIVLVEKFTNAELNELLQRRLEKAGYSHSSDRFFEPEALILALSLAGGNPRRFLYLLSEGMHRGYSRKTHRVEFQDLFEAVNEHLKLDGVCRKLLYFLAKSGRVVAANPDLQAFIRLDTISISRRLEILCKNHLAQVIDVVEGVKVYALPGSSPASEPSPSLPLVKTTRTESGEKVFELLNATKEE